MKRTIWLSLLLALAIPLQVPAATKIKIDSVPMEYRPHAGTERLKPLSMQGFYFEVNKETARARVAVEYTYPGAVGDHSSGDPGPSPTFAQLPGLTYDPAAHAVVYEAEGKKTICAEVQEKKVLGRTSFTTKSTGACVVTAAAGEHTEDDGWSLHRSRIIDIYFEVP